MNYTNIYENLIANAKLKQRTNNKHESHHIVPKCIGGTNDSSNIIYLTLKEYPEDHFPAVRFSR